MWMRFTPHFEAGKQGNIHIMSELPKFDPCPSYLTQNHGQLSEVSAQYHVIIGQCFHLALPYSGHHIDELWAHRLFTDLLFSLPFLCVVYLSNCPTWPMGCMNLFLRLPFIFSQLHMELGDGQASIRYSGYSDWLVVLELDINPPHSCPRYTTLGKQKTKAKHWLEVEICEVTVFDHLSNSALSTAYNAKKSL